MEDVFLESVNDIEPTVHQMTRDPNVDKVAVCCPATIYFAQSVCFRFGAQNIEKMCEQAAVILVHADTHTHTSIRAPLRLAREGEDAGGKGKGDCPSVHPSRASFHPPVRPPFLPSADRPSRTSDHPSDRPTLRPPVRPFRPTVRPSVRPPNRPTARPSRASVRSTHRPTV